MGDNAFDYDNDDDDFEFGDDVLSKVRKADRAKGKRIKELEELLAEREKSLTELSGKVKVTGVSEILKARGANPALARYALKDDVEATEEAVDAWLSENGALFGYEKPEATDAPSDSGSESGDVDMTALSGVLAAMQRVQNGEATAAPALAGTDKISQLMSAIDTKAASFEDVEKALGQAGLLG